MRTQAHWMIGIGLAAIGAAPAAGTPYRLLGGLLIMAVAVALVIGADRAHRRGGPR